MTLSSKGKIIKASYVLMIIMILINIICFTSLPSSMIIRAGKSVTLPKIILLAALPIMSHLIIKVAKEDDHPKSGMFNIIGQVVLFVSNLLVIYINII